MSAGELVMRKFMSFILSLITAFTPVVALGQQPEPDYPEPDASLPCHAADVRHNQRSSPGRLLEAADSSWGNREQ